MLHSYRSWLACTAAVVLATLAARPAAAADLRYLPPDTAIVVSLNFRQMLDSPLAKAQKDAVAKAKTSLQDKLNEHAEVQDYLKALGFDVFRDLTSITIAHPGGKDPHAALFIIEGDFDPEKFHAAAAMAVKDHGDVVSMTKEGKHQLIEITLPNHDHSTVVVMANKNTILACSTKDKMRAALTRGEGSETAKLSKELKELLKTTNPKQSISAVLTGAALGKIMENAPIPNAQGADQAVKGIDGLSAAVTITKDVQFQIGVTTKDTKTAQMLAQQANVGLFLVKGIVAQKAKEDEKLLPLVDVANTLSATAQGVSLLVRGEITLANIDKLLKSFPQAGR